MAFGFFAVLAAIIFATRSPAQTFESLKMEKEPLVLKGKGSFFVGGDKVYRTQQQLGIFGPKDGGHVFINQMYVQYMLPVTTKKRPPLVFINGSHLTAKTWETTPDGRMGWDEFFVRQGYPVYVVDQVDRGRSGFDSAVFNEVKRGTRKPEELPEVFRPEIESGFWNAFRIGPKFGTPYADTRFPVDAMDELAKSGISELYDGPELFKRNSRALAELSNKLDGAVLIGHSMGGGFVLETGADFPANAKAIINVDGPCPIFRNFSDEEVRKLARMPVLMLFGDHLETPTGVTINKDLASTGVKVKSDARSEVFSFKREFDKCKDLASRINAAGGHAQLLFLPDRGIHGNSHMLMADNNSLEIGALIDDWIDKNAK